MSTCTCKQEIEAKLLERFKTNSEAAEDHRANLDGYALVLQGNTMLYKPAMPYKLAATYTAKTGSKKRKTVTGSMIFSYCPFCGTALKDTK